jgi:23S rRNA pseudouridine1911/1915/1917 synthase
MTRVTTEERLDRFVAASVPGLSRNEAEVLIAAGGVKVDGRRCTKKGTRLMPGASVEVDPSVLETRSAAERETLAQKEADLRLLDRGDDWAVIRKPAGLGSTPLFFGDVLAFSAYTKRLLSTFWPEDRALVDDGLVHRLDVGTSGACVIARTAAALSRLQADRDNGRLKRTYWAIVDARVADHGMITTAIAHHPSDDKRMVVVSNAFRGKPQEATTTFTTLARANASALIAVSIVGGRRHQIRVHMASIGFPLRGDGIYGGSGDATRLGLHATHVELICPTRGAVTASAEPGAHFWAFEPALERGINHT